MLWMKIIAITAMTLQFTGNLFGLVRVLVSKPGELPSSEHKLRKRV